MKRCKFRLPKLNEVFSFLNEKHGWLFYHNDPTRSTIVMLKPAKNYL